MRVFRHSRLAGDDRGAVVAVGNFDGLHMGHQAVIARARALAEAARTHLAVLTFEPHPRSVFQPGAAPFRLTPFRPKARLIASLGVDLLIAHRFDLTLAQESAEDFVRRVLVAELGARQVVVGFDFVFGNRRRGTAELLRTMGAALGFAVEVMEPVSSPLGAIYSSTRIRQHLAAGEPRAAAALLGRPWEIEGRVAHGDHRGRTIGFPTANLGLADYLRPAAGVYAIRAAVVEAGAPSWHDGAANLGTRPTVGGSDLRLEAHLFGFAGDLYGRHLRVALVEHLRPEQRFSGLDALKAQIAQDCAEAERVLAGTA